MVAVAASKIIVEISNRQKRLAVDRARLRKAVRDVFAESDIERAEVSIAIVDDATIHEVNRDFLNHDYATDVISFVLEDDAEAFEGEIVISADTAMTEAKRRKWKAEDELLLYAIHGALHLTGYDDTTPKGRRAMRAAEKKFLAMFGIERK